MIRVISLVLLSSGWTLAFDQRQVRPKLRFSGSLEAARQAVQPLEAAKPAVQTPASDIAMAVVGHAGIEMALSLTVLAITARMLARNPEIDPVFNALPWLLIIFRRSDIVGGPVDTMKGPSWYTALNKPSWTPPMWLFPIIWIPLKLLQLSAATFLWESRKVNEPAVVALTLHLALGVQWNHQFFAKKRILTGLYVLSAYWGALLAAVAFAARVSMPAAALLSPSLVWVTVALALNFYIWKNNQADSK